MIVRVCVCCCVLAGYAECHPNTSAVYCKPRESNLVGVYENLVFMRVMMRVVTVAFIYMLIVHVQSCSHIIYLDVRHSHHIHPIVCIASAYGIVVIGFRHNLLVFSNLAHGVLSVTTRTAIRIPICFYGSRSSCTCMYMYMI